MGQVIENNEKKEITKDTLNVEKSTSQNQGITIYEDYSYKGNANKNLIWYRGNAHELSQFYRNHSQSELGLMNFWGATSTKGLEIRKIHTGMPKLIVDKLASITLSDLNNIEFDEKNKAESELWDTVYKENNIEKLLLKATKRVLITGDGAFKITFKESISKYPIVEFFSGQDVEYTYEKGRLREIKFYTQYKEKGEIYTLEEIYGYGYIKYKLYKKDEEASLKDLDATSELEDIVWDTSKPGWNVMLASRFSIFDSENYEGRGASIYDGKTDLFDAYDEAISQWMDAIRKGRTKVYIPDCLIPRDENNGALLKPNPFDNVFVTVGTDMSPDAKNEIKVEQPLIQVEAYLTTCVTLLDAILQGLMSPATLGVDVKKLDNAESQREKEKTTLYTRQSIVDALTETIKDLINVVISADAIQNNKTANIDELEISVVFGEYANPSFEAVVEVTSIPNASMSTETKVEEMWGDTKDEEWKKAEVRRIKEEQGIIMMEEPAISVEL